MISCPGIKGKVDAPLVAHLMQIAVTDTAEVDVDYVTVLRATLRRTLG